MSLWLTLTWRQSLRDEFEQLRGAHPGRLTQPAGGRRHSGPLGRPAPAATAPQPRCESRSSTGHQTRRSVWSSAATRRTSASRSRTVGRPWTRSTLDQIFDPLKRGPAAQKSDTTDGGLGLGLHIVREVARAAWGRGRCAFRRRRNRVRCTAASPQFGLVIVRSTHANGRTRLQQTCYRARLRGLCPFIPFIRRRDPHARRYRGPVRV